MAVHSLVVLMCVAGWSACSCSRDVVICMWMYMENLCHVQFLTWE